MGKRCQAARLGSLGARLLVELPFVDAWKGRWDRSSVMHFSIRVWKSCTWKNVIQESIPEILSVMTIFMGMFSRSDGVFIAATLTVGCTCKYAAMAMWPHCDYILFMIRYYLLYVSTKIHLGNNLVTVTIHWRLMWNYVNVFKMSTVSSGNS